jgi:hypothetical protein
VGSFKLGWENMTWEQFNPFSSSVQTLIIPSLGTNLLVHMQHKERNVTAIKLKKTITVSIRTSIEIQHLSLQAS